MRTVHTADGIQWLREQGTLPADHAIITSLPDSSEVPALGFEGWRRWFSDTSELICRALAPSSAAIFFQTDVKREGAWVDKAYLVQRGAEAAGSALLWHKIVCRAPAGTVTFGRPAYAHLLCFSRELKADPSHSTADVLPRLGEMTWARAMGVEACVAACRFLRERAGARVIVDPFCGLGTALAVANTLGLDSIGVELSKKRAEKARTLSVRPA
jgi:hypothetical protein